MSAPTPTEARQDLAALVTSAAIAGVQVYDHEPPAITAGVSVTCSTSGVTPTDWNIAVRVYVSDTTVEAAQDTLDATVVAVDNALGPVPRGDWDFGYDDDRGVFIATAVVPYPREDF